ncbi:type I pantothenate kinase [Edaphobacter albus]|uniref:type I pantothenate kinase n=1 Tax=Edaphobacter sp. 4G125 TaxID=2763071 RepID=UPI00164565AA|nr:type I pantothenate kinase [Edaphobacter sp. 4G125]QNI38084.1 type I pantothenate kinase [Edaphobacter sp. 4G125]
MTVSSPFRRFTRQQWAALSPNTPLPLTDEDIAALRGLCDRLSLAEVAKTYLPISSLLKLRFEADQQLLALQNAFVGRKNERSPFVIAISGSVSVGKSTFARTLQALLSRWPCQPNVALITTDGFLYPNAILQEKGLMRRKGFPESYDLPRLLSFLHAVKSGEDVIEAPVYSHLSYDILPDQKQTVRKPDVLIFEGLNVLQAPPRATVIASDYFDFSIFLEADKDDLERWYVERFLALQRTAFQNPASYFYRYRTLDREEAIQTAQSIWREINLPNLVENIQPTRQRADLILNKGSDHQIETIWLRR